MVYQADYAKDSYDRKRRKSVRPVGLDKDTKDTILHDMSQNFSPEMMVKAKGAAVPVSTIYYWIHQGNLGINSDWMLYPRKRKGRQKKASPRFKPAGLSIEERPDAINRRLENGHYEIDTVILTKAKNECLLTLTDRRR